MAADGHHDAVSRYGPRRLSVELTNICNLHCSYCLRDDDALHRDPASFLAVDVLARLIADARTLMEIEHVAFTGGEPTLHPGLAEILGAVASLRLTCSFVTNGWNFDRIWPIVAAHRPAVTHVSFSLDGNTREAHDRWRGAGSFDRVVRAFSRCWSEKFPFRFKVAIRRDTLPELERFALFAARMGAAGLSFAHVLPTSAEQEDTSALTLEERTQAEREIAQLARILRMPVTVDVGYYNTDPSPPCSPLKGVSGNVDYRGRLTLCCNLSGFRGGTSEADVVADLTAERLDAATDRLRRVAATQLQRRARALAELDPETPADLMTGSPCLFCLQSFGKVPWRTTANRVLALREIR